MSTAERAIRVRLYALLREHAGRAELVWTSRAATPEALFNELQQHHRWPWPRHAFRAAVNDTFCAWDHPLQAGDEVAFIPPVAGG
jgi:molybdopterin synthase sulfur carrier subunit